MPTEKYAHAPEIRTHCSNIGKQFGSTTTRFFTPKSIDHLATKRQAPGGNSPRRLLTTQFIGMGTGPLHVPKLPGIPGIETFKGHLFTPVDGITTIPEELLRERR